MSPEFPRPAAAAALLALSALAHGQGHQLPTWDSSEWVPGSVHGGVQPVDDWWFYAVELGETHGENVVHEMTWNTSGTAFDCAFYTLPECWGLTDPAVLTTCTYFTEYTASPVEREQSASALASVRAWDAPNAGVVLITTPSGEVRKAQGSTGGDGSMIRIYRNDLKIYERHLAENDTTGFDIDDAIPVNAGDRLWFHNDPGESSLDDQVIFQPKLVLSAGTGYDPDPFTHESVADFLADHTQGANGWTYEAFERSTNTYSQMTVTGTDGFGRYWQQGTSCKVWSDRQQPSATHDAVRVWTATQDGFLMLRSLTPFEKLATGDPVAVQIRHIHDGTTTILWQGTVTDADDLPTGAIASLRTGDRVAVHVDAVVSSPSSSLVGVDLELEVLPGGEVPKAVIDHGQGDVSINANTLWFYEHHVIEGNLLLEAGELAVVDGSVTLVLEHENQYTFQFNGGDLATTRATLTGGSDLDDPLHMSFQFWHPGDARWRVEDTLVDFCYGILMTDPSYDSVLEGTGLTATNDSDLVHMGENAHVTLADSKYRFRLLFPANVSGDITFDLPMGEVITETVGASEFPGVSWTLDLTDTEVINWALAPYAMTSGTGITKTVHLEGAETIWAEMTGTNLQGSVVPFTGTLTQAATGTDPNERQYLDTFNVRWQSGTNPTDIDLWAVYFQGPQTVVSLTPAGGPTNIAELFSFGGARVSYIGATGQHDAVCGATVVRCFEPNSRLVLKNCTLGNPWIYGSIRAEDGALIVIDNAFLVDDIALQAVCGSTILVTNVDPNSTGSFVISADNQSTIKIDGVTQNSNGQDCP